MKFRSKTPARTGASGKDRWKAAGPAIGILAAALVLWGAISAFDDDDEPEAIEPAAVPAAAMTQDAPAEQGAARTPASPAPTAK